MPPGGDGLIHCRTCANYAKWRDVNALGKMQGVPSWDETRKPRQKCHGQATWKR